MTKMHPQVREAMEDSINGFRCSRNHPGYPKSLAELIRLVRLDMDEAREAVAAAETKTEAASAGPATWNEIYSDLSVAASRRQAFGASDAQVRLIATLAVKKSLTLSQISMNVLTKAEASAIIDSLK